MRVFILLSCVLLVCYDVPSVAARALRAAGDIESETTVYLDPNGGVAPLSERLEKAQEDNELKHELLLAEAECKKEDDDECSEVKEIKEEIASTEEESEETTAPCYQSVFWSYFLGTVCKLPPDSDKDGNDKASDK